MSKSCFECGASAVQDHHVIPRSRVGKKTVPLCDGCHSRAHGIKVAHPQLTKDALQAKKARGERTGTVRRGYTLADDGKTLVVNQAEQQTIDLILRLFDSGLTVRGIAAELEARGVVTRNGKPLGFSAVGKITRGYGRFRRAERAAHGA